MVRNAGLMRPTDARRVHCCRGQWMAEYNALQCRQVSQLSAAAVCQFQYCKMLLVTNREKADCPDLYLRRLSYKYTV